MTHHKIIQDEVELDRFIEWLPDLEENETFYVVLQARKKYMASLMSSDTVEVRRFTCGKDRLKEKLRQLECPVGCYKTKKGQVVNNDGLAIYITTNPRDTKKATAQTVKDLVDHMSKGWGDENYRFNPVRWADRQIHKCKSRTCHVHFDVDFLTETPRNEQLCEIQRFVLNTVGKLATTIFETRGGCHVLIKPNWVISSAPRDWYKVISSGLPDVDQSGDLMLPIPGCVQGGFTPRRYI